MLPTYAFYLSLLAIITSSPAMASSSSPPSSTTTTTKQPSKPIDDIQCHCLTFYTYAAPAACAYPHSQNLSWPSAQTLASSHNLDITFASPTSISRVLGVEQPLPTSVLMTMYRGHGRAKPRHEVGSRIVCGSYEEVKRKYLGGDGRLEQAVTVEARRCDGLVSEIIAIFLLMLVLYAVGDYLWSRFFTKRGRILLVGCEKDLLAHAEMGSVPSFTAHTLSTPPPSLRDEKQCGSDSSTHRIDGS